MSDTEYSRMLCNISGCFNKQENYEQLLFLLLGILPIATLANKEKNALDILNALDTSGKIHTDDVGLLEEIANLMELKSMKIDLNSYMKKVMQTSRNCLLTTDRKQLFTAIRNMTPNDIKQLNLTYNVRGNEFQNSWTLAFYLETYIWADTEHKTRLEHLTEFKRNIESGAKSHLRLECSTSQDYVNCMRETEKYSSKADTAQNFPLDNQGAKYNPSTARKRQDSRQRFVGKEDNTQAANELNFSTSQCDVHRVESVPVAANRPLDNQDDVTYGGEPVSDGNGQYEVPTVLQENSVDSEELANENHRYQDPELLDIYSETEEVDERELDENSETSEVGRLPVYVITYSVAFFVTIILLTLAATVKHSITRWTFIGLACLVCTVMCLCSYIIYRKSGNWNKFKQVLFYRY